MLTFHKNIWARKEHCGISHTCTTVIWRDDTCKPKKQELAFLSQNAAPEKETSTDLK